MLEVSDSLSTDEFINALRRFICVRARPHALYSNNGTNFMVEQKELKRILKEIDQTKVENELKNHGIRWSLIPQTSVIGEVYKKR